MKNVHILVCIIIYMKRLKGTIRERVEKSQCCLSNRYILNTNQIWNWLPKVPQWCDVMRFKFLMICYALIVFPRLLKDYTLWDSTTGAWLYSKTMKLVALSCSMLCRLQRLTDTVMQFKFLIICYVLILNPRFRRTIIC